MRRVCNNAFPLSSVSSQTFWPTHPQFSSSDVSRRTPPLKKCRSPLALKQRVDPEGVLSFLSQSSWTENDVQKFKHFPAFALRL
jgi:hypothetical protein